MASVAGLRPIGPVGLESLRRRYDAGIRQLDDELARLFEGLRAAGGERDSIVVVTSDHGEEFHEHGNLLHGRSQYEEQLRVPLIVRGPGVPRGVRVKDPVSGTGIAPTLLRLLDQAPPSELDGLDLSALWSRAGNPDTADTPATKAPRALFAEAAPGMRDDSLHAVRAGRFKLIRNQATGATELYDLYDDPGERLDLSQRRPLELERLTALLDRFHAARRAPEAAPELAPEEAQQLRELGYH
jgi:arylsulfatase A-like enzyme